MKRSGNIIVLVVAFVLLCWCFAVPVKGQEPGAAKPTLAEIDALMVDKTVENCEKAIKGYELLLKDEPNNVEILWKLSDAYISIIDIKTSYIIEEKDEYKPILKNLGKPANDYAEKALKLNPNSKEAVAAGIRAYAYYSSSFGIMKAMFKGAAGHFKDLCNQMIKLDDKFMGALGYLSMGKFYYMAPWPVGSDSKSLKFFKKAVETDNTRLYSHYYVGVLNFEDKNWNLAEKEFVFVRDNPPSDYEKHFFDIYKKKADEYLAKIAKKKK